MKRSKKGFWPGVITYGPFVGIYFVLYEQGKRFGGWVTGSDPEELGLGWHICEYFFLLFLDHLLLTPALKSH